MKAQWGISPPDLPDARPAWHMEADYRASICADLTYIIRPDRIILGGGVLQRSGIYEMIRPVLAEKLGGYDASVRRIDLDSYGAAPGAGSSAALWGAVATAYRLVERRWPSRWQLASTHCTRVLGGRENA